LLIETQKGKFTRQFMLEKQMEKYTPHSTFEEQFKKKRKKELNKSKT